MILSQNYLPNEIIIKLLCLYRVCGAGSPRYIILADNFRGIREKNGPILPNISLTKINLLFVSDRLKTH